MHTPGVSSPFRKVTRPLDQGPILVIPLSLNCLLKASFLNAVTWGGSGLQHVDWGDTVELVTAIWDTLRNLGLTVWPVWEPLQSQGRVG